MILSACYDISTNIVLGFLVSTPLMVSILILYEKYTEDVMSYTAGLFPLIIVIIFLLSMSILVFFVVMADLLQMGCVTWHRSAVGYLI